MRLKSIRKKHGKSRQHRIPGISAEKAARQKNFEASEISHEGCGLQAMSV